MSQFDGGRSETEEQADELSTTTGSTSKPKTTTKTTVSAFSRRAPDSSSGVSVQQSVGLSPVLDTCVPKQDTNL